MTSFEWVIFAVKAFFAVAVIIAVVLFVLVPLWRHLRSGPDPETLNPTFRELDVDGEELEIPSGGRTGKPDRHAVIEQAKQDPRVTANMISNWLKQKN